MTAQTTVSGVSAMYDQLSSGLMDSLGGAIHVGYWDEGCDNLDIEAASDLMTTKVGDRLAITGSNMRILDIGCGTGQPAVQISANYNVNVTGITISKEQVDIARGRVQSTIPPAKVDIHLANAMDLPFDDGSFHGAWAIESLCHMHDRRKALAHIARVLRPGSRLVIADMLLDVESGSPDAEIVGRICGIFQVSGGMLTAADYRELLQEAGFDVLDLTNIRKNVLPSSEIMVNRLEQLPETLQDDEAGRQLRAMAAELRRVNDCPQVAYALVTAVRRA
ncbi:S-adenosyl-L-methionine-dependent methyltransferase [Aspergillus stella-maris]|uniref:S-adenosyl-L-methionine-dependent methyltransferase n=1 Tax=Aspergillus stella-maris TaxID=1810926 RepID=UPI003CCDB8FA